MKPPSPPPPHRPLSPRLRDLKGAAQLLKPLVHVGRAGVTPALIAALDEALLRHELVKLRFLEHKEDRRRLAAELALQTGSRLIQQVGHVAVFYRPRPEPAAAPAPPSPPPA